MVCYEHRSGTNTRSFSIVKSNRQRACRHAHHSRTYKMNVISDMTDVAALSACQKLPVRHSASSLRCVLGLVPHICDASNAKHKEDA